EAGVVGTVENSFRFPGQHFDQETGLHYNYFRHYNPGTGRYLRPDPIGLLGGVNLYVYASNNSILLIDPYGLQTGFDEFMRESLTGVAKVVLIYSKIEKTILWFPTAFVINRIPGAPNVPYWPPFSPPEEEPNDSQGEVPDEIKPGPQALPGPGPQPAPSGDSQCE
ncbi:MAG: RHS repeat-associated core domain-containing protein, partial [Pseudomonadota bacterium]